MDAIALLGSLLAAGLIMLLLSARSWKRNIPGAKSFSLMVLSIGVWCFLYAAEALVGSVGAKTAVAVAEYLGIVSVPVLWLVFCLRYTGHDRYLTRWAVALLFVVPAITFGLAATNWLHGLVWSSVGTHSAGRYALLSVDHGPYFWVHLAYSYSAILAGAIVLVSSTFRSPRVYREQAALIVCAAVVPWVANLLYALGITPHGDFDLTPFAFAATGGMLALALSRYRMLDLFLGLQSRARSMIIDTMPEGFVVLDSDSRVIDYNSTAAHMLSSRSPADVEARLFELLPAERVNTARVDLETAGEDPLRHEADVLVDGEKRSLEILLSPLACGRGCRAAHLVRIHDITARKKAEQAARESQDRYRTLVENAHDLIFSIDEEGRLSSVNPAVETVTGYSKEELLGRLAWELTGTDGIAKVKQLPQLDGGATRSEVTLRSKDGREVVLDTIVREEIIAGRHAGFHCIARDVTESRHWEEALRFQALHDTVTGLPNRLWFRERATEYLARYRATSAHFAICILDLDHFKDVNDTLGHHLGDGVLEIAGRRLKHALRQQDLLARLGGDEFVMLLSVTDTDEARRVAHRVLQALSGPCYVEGQEFSLTASLGVAVFPTHGSTIDTLLRVADLAMYSAKEAGGGRYAMYETIAGLHSADRKSLQSDVRKAFERGQLALYYQPLVSLRELGAPLFEALVRWNHPHKGLILPGDFLSLLEQDGFGDQLGRWALNKALAQCARWRARGFDTGVSVNLSARDLDNPDLAELIEGLLHKHKAAPDWLMIELTEGSVLLDPEKSAETLAAIRSLGVKIAIDDFGAGQSSFPYLKKIQADVLKIDKSYVTNMPVDKNDAAIVRSTIGLAHELGLTVVGEGVENEATLRLLRAYGCDLAQGYFLGRPKPSRSISHGLRALDGEKRAFELGRVPAA